MTHQLKLGKHPATTDKRDLQFHKYVDTDKIDIDKPPPAKDLGHADRMPEPRLMLGNGPDDTVAKGFGGAGDCVFACITNYLRLAWNISGKSLFPATGKQAIQAYSEVTGYVVGDDSTDQGTNMRDAMNWWRKTGYADANGKRHKIGAYAAIDPSNINHLLWALYLIDEGVPLGIQFPASAMDQFDAGKPWTVVPNSPIDGGHAILLDAMFKVESWARDVPTAQPFLNKYCDEAYFVVDVDGLVNGKTLEGIDSKQLLSDAKAFA